MRISFKDQSFARIGLLQRQPGMERFRSDNSRSPSWRHRVDQRWWRCQGCWRHWPGSWRRCSLCGKWLGTDCLPERCLTVTDQGTGSFVCEGCLGRLGFPSGRCPETVATQIRQSVGIAETWEGRLEQILPGQLHATLIARGYLPVHDAKGQRCQLCSRVAFYAFMPTQQVLCTVCLVGEYRESSWRD